MAQLIRSLIEGIIRRKGEESDNPFAVASNGQKAWLNEVQKIIGEITFTSATITSGEGYSGTLKAFVSPSRSGEYIFNAPKCKLYSGESLIETLEMQEDPEGEVYEYRADFSGLFPRPTVAEIVAEFTDESSEMADTISHIELI